MQSNLIRILDLVSSRNVLLGSGLATVFAMLGFQWLEGQIGAPMLDTMANYQRDELVEHMLLYGEAGRVLHARFTASLDMAFPFIYGPFFAGLLTLAARHTLVPFPGVLVLPVMLVDVLENIQLIALLWGFPDLESQAITLAGQTSAVKILLIQIVFAALPLLLLWQLFVRRKNA